MAYGAAGTTITGSPPACRVYNSANQATVTNAVEKALTFDTERFDTDNMHSTSSNTSRITFNTPGLYIFGTNFAWAAVNATGTREGYLKLNGTTYIATMSIPAVNLTQYINLSGVYKFAVNDYIEIMAFQSSGTNAVTINATGNYSPEFYATWIGLGT